MNVRSPAQAVLFAALACGTTATAVAAPGSPAQVLASDNRHQAGTEANGALTVSLVAGRGDWRPEELDGPALNVAAFGEAGGPLLTPGRSCGPVRAPRSSYASPTRWKTR